MQKGIASVEHFQPNSKRAICGIILCTNMAGLIETQESETFDEHEPDSV